MAKKNIKTKVIAGLVSSATVINGGTLAGILVNNEVETKNEAENKKRKQKNLAIIFPKDNRYLGKLYIGETTTASNDNNKIEKVVTSILKNKYHLNLDKIKINIDNNEKQVLVMTIDEDVYLGTVPLNYDLDTSPITLDYLVPDIKTRKQQVFPYLTNAHEDIVTVKHQILGENEFQDLSLAANFINELSQKVKFQASRESLNAFKKLETNNANFKDFTDLKTQFNDYNGQFKGQINLDTFIETITNNFQHYNKYNYYQINIAARINELKAQMVRFYNILAQVYGKKMF